MNEPNAIGAGAAGGAVRVLRTRARADPRRRARRARAAPPRPVRAVGALVGIRKRRRRPTSSATATWSTRHTSTPAGSRRADHARRLRGRAPRGARFRRGSRALGRVGHRPAPRRRPGRPLLPAPPGLPGLVRASAPRSGPGARAAATRTRSGMRGRGACPQVWGEFEVDCRTNRVTRLRRVLDQRAQARATCAPRPAGSTGTRYTPHGRARRRPGAAQRRRAARGLPPARAAGLDRRRRISTCPPTA